MATTNILLRILSLGKLYIPSLASHTNTIQIEVVYIAYRAYSSQRISQRRSVIQRDQIVSRDPINALTSLAAPVREGKNSVYSAKTYTYIPYRIITIILRRLYISVDKCIRAYKKVTQQAFTPKRTTIFPISPSGAFSTKALEGAIKQIVRDFYSQPEYIARYIYSTIMAETYLYKEMAFYDRSYTKTL